MRIWALVFVLLAFSSCASKSVELSQENYNRLVALPDQVQTLKQQNFQLSQQVEGMQEDSAMMRASLKKEIDEQRASVEELSSGGTRVTLQNEILFASGSVEINKAGRTVLAKVAEGLRKLPASVRIRVVGYTDSIPPGKNLRHRYTDNWELSASRAAAVARVLAWGEGLDPKRIYVEGRAYYDPVADNKTFEGRDKNRRMAIFIQRGK